MEPLAVSETTALADAKGLPSGRSVVVKAVDGAEEIEVRAPDGAVEVRITLTADGPVVRLSGARLELNAIDNVAVRCKRFEVDAPEEGFHVTGAEMRVRTEHDVHLNGKMIRLNCPAGDAMPTPLPRSAHHACAGDDQSDAS